MSDYGDGSKLFTAAYCAMIALGLLNCLFGQSSMATIPVLLNSRGISESLAAVLNMLFPFSCIFFRRYTVKIGSKVSCKWSVAFCFSMLLASNVIIDKITDMRWMIPIRIAQGLSICYIAGVLASLVAETVPEKRFDEGMGYFSIGIPAMSFLGPALSRILLARYGYSKMLYGLSVIMIVPILICCFCPIPDLRPSSANESGKSGKEAMIAWKAIPASLLLMCVSGAHTSIVSFLPLHAQKYNLNRTLFFYIAAGVGVFGIRIVTTVMKRRLPEGFFIPAGLLACMLVLTGLPKTDNSVLYMIMGLLYGIAQGFLQPFFISCALQAVPTDQKSIATVTYYIFNDIGTVVFGMAWGYIAQYLDYYSVFIVAAAANMVVWFGWIYYSVHCCCSRKGA